MFLCSTYQQTKIQLNMLQSPCAYLTKKLYKRNCHEACIFCRRESLRITNHYFLAVGVGAFQNTIHWEVANLQGKSCAMLAQHMYTVDMFSLKIPSEQMGAQTLHEYMTID